MSATAAQHAPQNAMDERDEIARFYDRCSDLMRELLGELARVPDVVRPSGRWEMWMDAEQARALDAARREGVREEVAQDG